MNINDLNDLIRNEKKIGIIGKYKKISDVDCHIIGFILKEKKLSLLILQYDDNYVQKLEEDEFAKINDLIDVEINRMQQKSERNIEPKNCLEGLEIVLCDNTEFRVSESELRCLNTSDLDSILLLSECLRLGWKPTGVDKFNIDLLFLEIVTFDGEFTSLPTIHNNTKIQFQFGAVYESIYLEKTIHLDFLNNAPYELLIENTQTGIEESIWVNRVYLCDIWKEMDETFKKIKEKVTNEEYLSMRSDWENQMIDICPKGMCYPVIEYECKSDINLQFYSKSWLDSEIESSNQMIAFLLKPDKKLGIKGLRLKAALIQEPISSNETHLDVELFSYQFFKNKEPIIIL